MGDRERAEPESTSVAAGHMIARCPYCPATFDQEAYLGQHDRLVHAPQRAQVVRERANAVVYWWDRCEEMRGGDIAKVTEEMDRRIAALREALEV